VNVVRCTANSNHCDIQIPRDSDEVGPEFRLELHRNQVFAILGPEHTVNEIGDVRVGHSGRRKVNTARSRSSVRYVTGLAVEIRRFTWVVLPGGGFVSQRSRAGLIKWRRFATQSLVSPTSRDFQLSCPPLSAKHSVRYCYLLARSN
jgi:hypothetical protein